MDAPALRQKILALVREFYAANWPPKPFVPGESPVPYGGRVFDAEELTSLVDSALDFWLTTGRYAEEFERQLAQWLGVGFASLCNSGSSANLLALSALTSPQLGERALVAGDEVLTVAAGFPTTVNPILQSQLVPVFVDVEVGTYNVDVAQIEHAIGPRTRAVMLAHALGNPFDLDAVLDIVRRHNLWLIEDNCDALGSTYKGRRTGTFGDLATLSFYPAHHMTMGEGGCVVGNQPLLKRLVESFRDWGRDCWCDPGHDNTCGKRFQWQHGTLPYGYDHKYVFSHVGYNLKLTEMQAAVGVAQLKKLPGFIEARKRNWQILYDRLKPLEEFFILPRATANSDPSWFGFPLTVRSSSPFTRSEIVEHLENRRIATRLMFAGNLVRQPAYSRVKFRVAGELINTDVVANQTFWIGVYPGLTDAQLDYVADTMRTFCRR